VHLIRKFRENIALRKITALAAKRPAQHRPLSIENADKIGIIYVCDNKYGECVPALLRQAPLKGKDVRVLKYRAVKPSGKTPQDQDTFSIRDTNWWYKPTAANAELFLAEQYDILIDLSSQDYLPLLYVMALAQSGLNVCRYSDRKKEVADLMIRLEGDEDAAILLNHIRHYLNQLNPS